MRSALAQVRGRVPEDSGEQQLKRKVLTLYRWTGDGTGLSLILFFISVQWTDRTWTGKVVDREELRGFLRSHEGRVDLPIVEELLRRHFRSRAMRGGLDSGFNGAGGISLTLGRDSGPPLKVADLRHPDR